MGYSAALDFTISIGYLRKRLAYCAFQFLERGKKEHKDGPKTYSDCHFMFIGHEINLNITVVSIALFKRVNTRTFI